MIWTTEKPTTSGWYWWRCAPDAPPKCEEVRRIDGLGLSWYGGRIWLKIDIKGGQWWPEPIPEPRDQACTIDQQAQEIARLREALEGILEIGKRDMTNPKYDVYFEQAQQALKDSQTSK